MVTIRYETPRDNVARESLLDETFGEGRFGKTAQRLRDGRLPAAGLSFVAVENRRVIGTVRLWDVTAGPKQPALLLGPIAVACDRQGRGVGGALMRHCIRAADKLGHAAVLLVGDAPYYSRFGFSAEKTGALWLPGRYEADRFLALELEPGALAGARGLVSATGRRLPRPARSTLVASCGETGTLAARAA